MNYKLTCFNSITKYNFLMRGLQFHNVDLSTVSLYIRILCKRVNRSGELLNCQITSNSHSFDLSIYRSFHQRTSSRLHRIS